MAPRPDLTGLLPEELVALMAAESCGAAQPVARLAACCRRIKEDVSDDNGRIKVASVVTSSLQTVTGLPVRLDSLQSLSVDLTEERRDLLDRAGIDHAVGKLGDALARTADLRVLSLRLASFDTNMERLRLGKEAWHSLLSGLRALANKGTLRSLELRSVAIKRSRALSRSVSDPATPASTSSALGVTFLDTIASLKSLEEISLTYDEIHDSTAVDLARAVAQLPCLRLVDLTRNHISHSAMKEIRKMVPPHVEVRGAEQQTFFY